MSGPAQFMSRRDALVCGLLLVAWALAAWVVNPAGEFSTNDDFAYSLSVRWMLEDGHFQRTPWTYVPALSNVLWGVPFAAYGHGFLEALRLSTLVAGALGVLGFFALARQAGATPTVAALAAATLGLSPLYFSLSATFMTDVHFTMWIVWSLFFLGRALRGPDALALALGAVCGAAAVLTRQSALALPLAFVAASLVAAPRALRSWVQAACVAAACFGAYAWFQWRFAEYPDVFSPGTVAEHFRVQTPSYQAARNTVSAVLYAGLLTLPLAPLFATRLRAGQIAAACVLGALPVAAIPKFFEALPPGMNVLAPFGIGPLDFPGADALPHLPPIALWILCGLGGFSFALAAFAAATQWRALLAQRAGAVLWLAFGALHLGMYLVRAPFFDRYLVPVLPAWVAVCLLGTARLLPATRGALWAGAAVLTVFTGVALAATHDFLARNRAAWQLAEREIAAGAPPETIDAGFSYDGWHEFKDRKRTLERPSHWLPTASREVTLAAPTGTPGEILYRRWLPPGEEAARFIPKQERK